MDEIAPPGRILDVGAGDGALMDALARRGREVVGLERDASRPDMRDERLDELDGEWAAIVFWHSLEHLPEPGEAIRHAARLLRPRGVVVVAVPDADSLQARAFGDRWLHLDPPRHLVHLARGRSSTGLERRGLRGRARLARARRPDRDRLARRACRLAAGRPEPLPGAAAPRRAPARPSSRAQRAASLAAGVAAAAGRGGCAAAEVALGRSGTVYVEARLA